MSNNKEMTLAEKIKKARVTFKYLPKAKKKKIIKRFVGFTAAALVVVLLGMTAYNWLMDTVFKPNDINYKDSYTVSDEEAIAKKDVVVATTGEEKMTNGLLKMFYWQSAISAIENYQYILGNIGLDPTKPLDKQLEQIEKAYTWQQMFILDAINYWRSYVARAEAAKKANVELPEDRQAVLDGLYDSMTKNAKENGYESAEAMIADQIGVGVTFEVYKRYHELYFWSEAYYNAVAGSTQVSMEEIEAYFENNADNLKAEFNVDKNSGIVSDVRYILIKPEDEDKDGKYSQEEWQDCLERAEEALQEWKDNNGTEESFAEMAKNMNTEEKAKENGGLCKMVHKSSNYAEAFIEWAVDKNRQTGDTDIVQTNNGYYIMYYVSGEQEWIAYSREMALSEKVGTHMSELTNASSIEVDFKKISLDEMILAVVSTEEE